MWQRARVLNLPLVTPEAVGMLIWVKVGKPEVKRLQALNGDSGSMPAYQMNIFYKDKNTTDCWIGSQYVELLNEFAEDVEYVEFSNPKQRSQ